MQSFISFAPKRYFMFLGINLHKYTKEFRYNIKLATPVILGMLGHTLVGFIDNAMVGQLGPTELAAVALGNSIIFLAIALGVGFSTAITVLTAESHGTSDIQKGTDILKHGMLTCGTLSFLLMGGLLFAEEIMYQTKQDKEVIALALPYINLVGISIFPLMIFQAFKQFSDGLSLTKYSMYVVFVGNILNVILNYLFIYGKFGCPELGVLGAGVGTLVSRFVTPILFWYILHKDPRTTQYVSGLNWKNIDFLQVKKIIYLGVPSSLQMVFEAGIFIVATWISGSLSKNHQAANQIALGMASMTFMFSAGMSTVAMIRVSNFKGISDYLNLRRVAISIFLLVGLCQVGLALFYITFNNWIPYIFLDSNDLKNAQDITFVIADAKKLLFIAGIFQIPDGIQIVILGALRGLQEVKIPAIISFISYWLIAFPVSYYLGIHTPLATSGIWIGLLVGLTAAAILLSLRFNHISKKMIQLA